MNKQKNRGITLIALVITIVVLVILVGVSVSVAINTGLIANSKKAVADYDAAQKSEEQEIQNVADLVAKYSGTAGKTIAELYDGINDPETANYNENAMHIGDYVNYTAGTWSETVPTPTEENPFTFGGYTVGQSRDTNYTGSSSTYEGWRIWDISDDKKTITLVSAGCPEAYYQKEVHMEEDDEQTWDRYAYNSELILTGSTEGTIDDAYPSTPRDWSDYLNVTQHATSARVLALNDFNMWCLKYFNSDSEIVESDYNHILSSTLTNGLDSYWLGNAVYWCLMEASELDSEDGELVFTGSESQGGYANGVRILVTLDTNVTFEKSSESVSHDGFTYNKWIIK